LKLSHRLFFFTGRLFYDHPCLIQIPASVVKFYSGLSKTNPNNYSITERNDKRYLNIEKSFGFDLKARLLNHATLVFHTNDFFEFSIDLID